MLMFVNQAVISRTAVGRADCLSQSAFISYKVKQVYSPCEPYVPAWIAPPPRWNRSCRKCLRSNPNRNPRMTQPGAPSPANLLVDDDAEIVDAMRYAGVEGVSDTRGPRRNQGLAMAESEHPNLVILDMMMPKRSGSWCWRNSAGLASTTKVISDHRQRREPAQGSRRDARRG